MLLPYHKKGTNHKAEMGRDNRHLFGINVFVPALDIKADYLLD
jgi:hypothetical protein